jgi:hypothetical protein
VTILRVTSEPIINLIKLKQILRKLRIKLKSLSKNLINLLKSRLLKALVNKSLCVVSKS